MAQGTITKHTTGTGGISWRARAETGVGVERKQRLRTFRTRKDVQTWLAQQATARASGIQTDTSKRTFGAFLDDWLDGPASRRLRPNTIRAYESLINSRIRPALGEQLVRSLTPERLEKFLHEEEATARPSTIRTLHAILRRSLRDAERLGLRANNPAMLVDGPRVPKQPGTAWDVTQARQFLAVADAHELAALWRLLITTGVRIGEALALRWDDVNLDSATIRIERTLTRNRQGLLIVGDTTKTPAGVRAVPVDAYTVLALHAQKAQVLVHSR